MGSIRDVSVSRSAHSTHCHLYSNLLTSVTTAVFLQAFLIDPLPALLILIAINIATEDVCMGTVEGALRSLGQRVFILFQTFLIDANSTHMALVAICITTKAFRDRTVARVLFAI